MRSIRALDSDRLEERLHAPKAAAEIAELTEEFNRLLDRLEETVSTMLRFTADASHELRTPLSILRVGLEVGLRQERTAAEYREVLKENLNEIERIQRIVLGLLTLARSRTGRSEKPTARVDLSEVAAGAVRSAEPMAEDRSIVLDSALEPNLFVRGDADQLRLMILNLVENAVKFTSAGKTVHIALASLGDLALLSVRDEGPGIAPEDRPFIFDRFFRGQGRQELGAKAGGLGLSVVRWVAENHGGSVSAVARDSPGATFEVRLPRLTVDQL
jgi:signal transduction histidine kinase